ncbi:four-carbon acid sugar kinase family protein [Corynebacterium otitidis]|uniref:Uncharacterized protein n=1 Tax=Corynebacterium otitidis ATCC 51513 TaxID=883169 RepID=I7IWU2_9CORY|nr:four-carbon acid sugar kinase family protein [Corynebacterium otitidis]EJZ82058.1 hypothetical protein HMPREF9719_01041 [Corynebacterium otitidis ATCC 51513]CCI83248.1 hypothetical protein BN46_0509 [Corynebacterium otitidis ATCC 51513]
MTDPAADPTASLPAPAEASAAEVAAAAPPPGEEVLVVLDDDPTGTQPVAGLPVLAAWEPADFAWALGTGARAIYVMTNSRSLSPRRAEEVNREVARNAYAAAKEAGGVRLRFASRSDSTLRGHFPLETDVLAEEVAAATGRPVDAVLLVPAFPDAGRVTVGGVHYARNSEGSYVPVGETEFAGDASFGFRSSRLDEWVEEKTGGRVPAAKVVSVPIEAIRRDVDEVGDLIAAAPRGAVIAADAVTEEDLRRLALGVIRAEARGRTLLYRVGPTFVRARIGLEPPAPLNGVEPPAGATAGGLVVVGSHVALTTRQLERLRAERDVAELVLDVEELLDEGRRDAHLAAVIDEAVSALTDRTVVVSTSRTLVRGRDADESLAIARSVSGAVVEAVAGIVARATPRFVVAKGGITSSDVATKGLGIRRAMVAGPLGDGIISLWRGADERSEGLSYVVFAGNVGDDGSLAKVVAKLSA